MQKGVANEFWRLTRFSIVGAVATGVYIVAAMIAVEVGGVAPVIGATIGYCASFLVSYIGHLRFTFAAPGRYRHYFLKFSVGSAASFCLSTTVVWVCTAILKIDYKPTLIGIGFIIPLCNYLINRFWVFFRPRDKSIDELEII